MSFAPGDVVVCVDDSPNSNGRRCLNVGRFAKLVRGRAYLITEAWIASNGLHVLVDHEEPHRIAGYLEPAGWNPDRFRKIERADEEFAHQIRSLSPRELA